MNTYSTHGNIRTKYPLERAYTDRHGNFLSFIISVEYQASNGDWYDAGLRWVINGTDIVFVMENGFKEFPHRVS